MASTSTESGGAAWNARRSSDTSPKGPATATVGSSSAFARADSEVSLHLDRGVENHDEGRGRAPDARVERRRPAQARGGAHHLRDDARGPGIRGVQRTGHLLDGVGRPVGHHDDAGAVRRMGREPADGARKILRPVADDEQDGGHANRRFREPGRDRCAGSVAHDPARLEVRCGRALEVVERARVDHLPAGRLDAGLEGIRGRPVAGTARCGACIGKRRQLGRGVIAGHGDEDTATRPSMPEPAQPAGHTADSARSHDRDREDPGMGEPAPEHGAGAPVQPAVQEPPAERAQGLELRLAEVHEGERQGGDDDGDRPHDAKQREQQEPAVEELGRDDLQGRGEPNVERRCRLGCVVGRQTPAAGRARGPRVS